MPLLDAETFYRHDLLLAVPAAEWAPRQHWTAHLRPDPLDITRPGPPSFQAHTDRLRHPMALALDVLPALVVVNDGRWVVHCPDPGCSEAQIASRGDRRFFCTFCLNREAGGHWRPVWWTDDAEVAEIERILGARQDPKRQQWWPSDGDGKPRAEVAVQLRQIQQAPLPGFAGFEQYETRAS